MTRQPRTSLGEPADRRRDRAALILCCTLAVLCYANTLGNGFCDDDHPIIVRNPLVTEPGNWGRLWVTEYWHGDPGATPYRDLLYRPVAILSYRLNHALGGLAPSGYHAVNIVLHALASGLAFRLTRRLGGCCAAGVTAGLLFAVLPIHTEAVNNVVGRAELLAAGFVLLSLECFARGDGWSTLAAGSICAFAACCSKESGAGVVLLVPLLDGLGGRRGWSGRFTAARVLRRYAGLVVAAGAYLLLRYVALGGALYQPVTLTKTVNVLADAGLWERVCGAFQLWGMYWGKTLWPRVLCLDYSINAVAPAGGLFTGYVLLGVLVLVLLGTWCWVGWRRGSLAAAVITAALLLCYFPASNTVVLIKTYFAERVWYVPSVWVAVMAGMLLFGSRLRRGSAAESVCEKQRSDPSRDREGAVSALSTERFLTGAALRSAFRAPSESSRWSRGDLLRYGLVAVAVAAGLTRCWARNEEWRDEGRLYAAAYRDHPTAIRAVLLYGRWLAQHGQFDEGVALMKQATLIDLGFTDAHRALGMAYLRARVMDQALEHLQMADVQIPGHPGTQQALAEARAGLAAVSDQRIALAERAVAETPDDLEALSRLADVLTESGRPAAAVERLLAAEPRFGGQAPYQHRLAAALVMANRRDEGADRYRRAIELDPDDPVPMVELAMLLLDRRAEGDLEDARRLADRAGRLAPDSVQVRVCRAELLILDGRRAEAGALYRQIAAQLPAGSDFQRACLLKADALER